MATELSVIIPVAGRHDHLQRLLASIVTQSREVEVMVIDMTHGDRALDAIAETNEPSATIRLERCAPTTSGSFRLGESRNLGAAVATSDRLVFLDVDALVTPGALAGWRNSIDRSGRALLSPPLRYLRDGWTESVDEREAIGSRCWIAHSAPAARPTPIVARVATSDEVDLFWSVAFCCSAATFGRIGGFDPGFVGYGAEDTDFARRARQVGVDLVWLSTGVVYHQYHPPSRHEPAGLADLVRNARRFHARWAEWPMPTWLDELTSAGLLDWDPDGGHLRVASGTTRS